MSVPPTASDSIFIGGHREILSGMTLLTIIRQRTTLLCGRSNSFLYHECPNNLKKLFLGYQIA